MKIGFDLDETLTCMLESWLEFLNYKHGTNVKVEDCLWWEMDKMFPNLTAEEIYEPLHLPVYWRSVVAKPGMVALVNKLKAEGHTVFVTTASHYATLIPKFEQSLFKLYPMFNYKDVIIVFDKSTLNLDVLVDDNPDNLINFRGLKLLVDMPYNRLTSDPKMIRVYSEEDIYDIISG